MHKKNIPYYQVAREAFIKKNGLTEEQADKMIEESSFEDIESQVGVKSSMSYAIEELATQFNLNDGAKSVFSKIMFGESQPDNTIPVMTGILRGYQNDIDWFDSARTTGVNNRNGYDVNRLAADMIDALHDGWIRDNAESFFTEKKIEANNINIYQ